MFGDLAFHQHRDEVPDGPSFVLEVSLLDQLLDALWWRVREPATKTISQLVESADLFGLGHESSEHWLQEADNRYRSVGIGVD